MAINSINLSSHEILTAKIIVAIFFLFAIFILLTSKFNLPETDAQEEINK